jgi:hypothetical protein
MQKEGSALILEEEPTVEVVFSVGRLMYCKMMYITNTFAVVNTERKVPGLGQEKNAVLTFAIWLPSPSK